MILSYLIKHYIFRAAEEIQEISVDFQSVRLPCDVSRAVGQKHTSIFIQNIATKINVPALLFVSLSIKL